MEKKKPEIRFNGFEEEWVRHSLNYYLTVSSEKNQEGQYSKYDIYSVSREYGVINQIEYQGKSFAGASLLNYGVVQTEDIVYTKSPLKSQPYGIIKVNSGKSGLVSALYGVFHPQEPVCSYFVQVYFDLDHRLNSYLRPLVNKGAKNTLLISDADALQGEVIFPSRDEQEKLVSFFTTLDKLIAKLEAKLDKLRKLKQALLEKMFVNVNRGGYETPEIRFKGYTDKWQVKELGELAIFNPPNQPLKELFYYIDLESVEKGFLKIKEQVTKRMAPSRAQRTLEFNDILFQTVRPYLQNHYLFKKNTQNNQWVASTGYALLRPKIYPELLYTMLLSEGFMQEVMQRCTGSTYPAINSKKMTDIKVGCSSAQMEQQLIGDLFILLDNQLNKTSTKLTKLRNIKQSLLQKMFAK